MDSNRSIKVGKSSFNVKLMKRLTQKDSLKQWHYLDATVVKTAYQLCNPKRKTKKKSD